MSKKLAIKGHPTRGKEVIELLEMMGGCSTKVTYGLYDDKCCLMINNNGWIVWDYISPEEINKYEIFTLEEFLKKYPFKVGDLKDLIDDHISCVISEMRWNERAECMEYHAEFGPNDHGWYRVSDFYDYQIEKFNTVISGINLSSCDYADEVELNLGDYKIEVRDGRTFAVKKKPKYPKTIEECVKLLGVDFRLDMESYKRKLMANFYRLIICRDAYWKIAGEQMGLSKPWKPDWENYNEYKYCIYITENTANTGVFYSDNRILAFPTEEMRDAFYENFKDLIEQCKELL